MPERNIQTETSQFIVNAMRDADLNIFQSDTAIRFNHEYYLITFKPYQLKSIPHSTTNMLMLQAFSSYYEDDDRPYFLFRHMPRMDKSRQNRAAFDFVGDFLNLCCSVVTEHVLNSYAIDAETLQKEVNRMQGFLTHNHQDLV